MTIETEVQLPPSKSRPRLVNELAPRLAEIVRPLDLADLPTPVTEEPALARKCGLKSLHIKRDDLTSPIYGGSKLRNLEYFLGKAIEARASGVATMGPFGSHQALATAVFSQRLGNLKSRALLVPQADVREARLNLNLLPKFDMEVIRCRSFLQVPYQYLRARFQRLGETRPFWIPPGSNHPLGTLGIVEGALELANAIRSGEIPMPDAVVVPTGTCATAAGLYLGFAIAELPILLVAVRVVPMLLTGPSKLKRMARKTLALLKRGGFEGSPRYGELLWLDDYADPGYAKVNPRAVAAMQAAVELTQLRYDATYTGKTLPVLDSPALKGRRVLFWNTYSARDPVPSETTAPWSQ